MQWPPRIGQKRKPAQHLVQVGFTVFTDPQLDRLGEQLGARLVGDVDAWLSQPEDQLLPQAMRLLEQALFLLESRGYPRATPGDDITAYSLLAGAAFGRLRQVVDDEALARAHVATGFLYLIRRRRRRAPIRERAEYAREALAMLAARRQPPP